MKKIIFYNLIIFSFIYLVLEILSGALLFNKIDCHYLLCNKNYTFKNEFGFYENGINEYKRDEFGFRGKRKQLSDIDILTIGGSTTDERYLNLEDTWSEKIEQLFLNNNIDIDVVNAGIDGQSTIGHIWNFKEWFPKLKDFRPKYIIFYIGLNERLFGNESSKYDNNLDSNKVNLIERIILLVKKNNGITYQFYNLIFKNFFYNETIDAGHKKRVSNYIIPKNRILLEEDQKNLLYKNLEIIRNQAKKLNSIPIFVSQKTLRGISIDKTNYSQNEFDILFYEKQIAEIIKEFANNNNILFIDLFEKLEFENKDLYDLIHTTPTGADKISKFIFDELFGKINFK